jgi:hypothetical protein
MTDITRTTLCSGCRQPVNTNDDAPNGVRVPCATCGSTARIIQSVSADLVSVSSEINFEMRGRSSERRKRTPKSQRRHIREQYVSLGLSADGIRRRAHQTYDRVADIYEEIVTDEVSGAIVWHLREPLSAHRDRGTAKRQTFRDAVSWAIATMAPEERPCAS